MYRWLKHPLALALSLARPAGPVPRPDADAQLPGAPAEAGEVLRQGNLCWIPMTLHQEHSLPR